MEESLLNIKDFVAFTFAATAQALKAEKILKENDAQFLMMPTLREISASCGLSIKFKEKNLEKYKKLLSDNDVSIDGIYHVEKVDNKNNIEEIDIK